MKNDTRYGDDALVAIGASLMLAPISYFVGRRVGRFKTVRLIRKLNK